MCQDYQISQQEIVAQWRQVFFQDKVSVTLEEATTHCWRCRDRLAVSLSLIRPKEYGGREVATNMVLLCDRCQQEQPRLADPSYVWSWLAAYRLPVANRFWMKQAMEEYERLFHKSVLQELWDLGCRDGNQVEELLSTVQASLPHREVQVQMPNKATLACLIRQEIEGMQVLPIAKVS